MFLFTPRSWTLTLHITSPGLPLRWWMGALRVLWGTVLSLLLSKHCVQGLHKGPLIAGTAGSSSLRPPLLQVLNCQPQSPNHALGWWCSLPTQQLCCLKDSALTCRDFWGLYRCRLKLNLSLSMKFVLKERLSIGKKMKIDACTWLK